MNTPINQAISTIKLQFPQFKDFPNNPMLPTIIYKRVLVGDVGRESIFRKVFLTHGWTNSWVDGIQNFHHYHSTGHEVLGIINGTCDVQFGGPIGEMVTVEAGDVIIIPAGVAHRSFACSEDFRCIGAYPDGQDYDMNYGKEEEKSTAEINIQKLALPKCDPVYGDAGPLKSFWRIVEFDGV